MPGYIIIATSLVTMLTICVSLLALVLTWLLITRRKQSLPPGPAAIPLLGSIPFISTKRGLFDWALDTAVTNHKLATVRFGPKTFFIINDFQLAKELFSREEFSGRSSQPFSLQHKCFNGQPQGIVSNDGRLWDAQRRFGLKTLKTFGYGKKSLEETINMEANEVIEKFLSACNKDFLISNDFEIPVINILWQLVAGKRFVEDDPEGKEVVNGVAFMFETYIKANFTPLRLLKTFPDLFDYKKISHAYDVLRVYNMKTIDEHEETLDEEAPRDFIDAYLIEMKNQGEQSSFNKEELAVCLFDFIAAGTETSSNTLKWIILYLTLYQDVQDRYSFYMFHIQYTGCPKKRGMSEFYSVCFTSHLIKKTDYLVTLIKRVGGYLAEITTS